MRPLRSMPEQVRHFEDTSLSLPPPRRTLRGAFASFQELETTNPVWHQLVRSDHLQVEDIPSANKLLLLRTYCFGINIKP